MCWSDLFAIRKTFATTWAKGVLLWKKDLLKVIRRARTGVASCLLPLLFTAVLSISFSGAQADASGRWAALVLMNMWLVAVDFGVYPVRIYKRLRPILLTYEISVSSLFVATMLFASVNLGVRCGLIILLTANHQTPDLVPFVALTLVTCTLAFFCFALGNLLAAFSLSLHEVFLYSPHFFFLLGIVTGFIQLPALTSAFQFSAGHPMAVMASFARSILIADNLAPYGLAISTSGMILAISFLLLSWTRRVARVVTLL